MTEAEWLNCTDPAAMMAFIHGKVSDRKQRLFAVACCRRIWDLLLDPRSQEAIDSAERYADGLTDSEILDCTFTAACNAEYDTAAVVGNQDNLYYAAFAARHTNYPQMDEAIEFVIINAGRAVAVSSSLDGSRLAHERANQAILARDIFANPYRLLPALSPNVLAWKDGLVVRLAQTAYEERQLPEGTLDNSRLAILADALEEAGCMDADMLGHLRGPGPHVRGCWPVDSCLGKS